MAGVAMTERDNRYRGGRTAEGRWGCAAAFVAAFPVFIYLLLAETLGDCAPDVACRKSFLFYVLLPTAFVAFAAGMIVKRLVAALRGNRED